MSKEIVHHQRSLIFLSLGGYMALMVVGMMDAILYNGPGIFLLFVIPGFALFSLDQPQGKNFSWYYPILIFGLSLIVFFLSFGGNLRATYYANLGAVEMARLDLLGWRGEGNIKPQPAEKYDSAVAYFNRALDEDQGNRTANYRLGLLAVNQQDFDAGCACLEKAYALDPGNRGIVKNLGYCYAWKGDINLAATTLQNIPEASNELEMYSWWWGTQNRDDLSGYASQVVKQLITTQQKGND